MLRFVPAHARTTIEFGCGCGRFSECVKRAYGTESWGVEVHEESAESARLKLDRVLTGDAVRCLEQLPDQYFDVVICNDVLEHLVDPWGLLRGVRCKLREHGVVVGSVPNVRYWPNLWGLFWDGDWTYTDMGVLDSTHLRFFTRKGVAAMFRESGYDMLRMEGLCPTGSRRLRFLNLLLMGRLHDARYMQFACVARQSSR